MFDIGWPELFLIAVVVLLVVGPKELPKVLRNVGIWVNKAKLVTREFRGHVDDMIRESELSEVRDQISHAGQADLESVGENSIGLKDEIEDALEYDLDDQSIVAPPEEEASDTDGSPKSEETSIPENIHENSNSKSENVELGSAKSAGN
jgi:sec-independent protein translocase protein TatB